MQMLRYDARMSAKKERAATKEALTNFLAWEEEQPLERQFNLLFDTVDHPSLRPGRWYHAGVCENIVI